MSLARLTGLGLQNFKCYGIGGSIKLRPLTVLLGRNNSGKSTIIQSLLLLKQTLANPRSEVQLHLKGAVDAFGLRDLTYRAPQRIGEEGPEFTIEWESTVDVQKARHVDGRPMDFEKQAKLSGVGLLKDLDVKKVRLRTEMTLRFGQDSSKIQVHKLHLRSRRLDGEPAVQRPVYIDLDGVYQTRWDGSLMDHIDVQMEHFIPHLQRGSGAGPGTGAVIRAFKMLYEQPLDDLKSLLLGLNYLGSTRIIPPSMYAPTSSPPENVGISGEFAAELLHARRGEFVHFLPLPSLSSDDAGIEFSDTVEAMGLEPAVNTLFKALGVKDSFTLDDVKDIGFRLRFGQFDLQHVGRGISYMLPVVMAGLIADPLLGKAPKGSIPLADYLAKCRQVSHLAMEEPESHMHPKVQTYLAHLMVSLARSGRQVLIETHSDHLVRRLRGMIARSRPGSEIEKWLQDNVNIVAVEQDEDGGSTLRENRLTRDGRIGTYWPADFMDEASDEERSISYAGAVKQAAEAPSAEEEYLRSQAARREAD